MKPLLQWVARHQYWFCHIPGDYKCFGTGATPQVAYARWHLEKFVSAIEDK